MDQLRGLSLQMVLFRTDGSTVNVVSKSLQEVLKVTQTFENSMLLVIG